MSRLAGPSLKKPLSIVPLPELWKASVLHPLSLQRRRVHAAFLVLGWCCACSREAETERPSAASSAATSALGVGPSSAPPKEEKPQRALPNGERRTVAEGELRAGTHPAEFARNAALEPLPFRIKLGEFEVDALPYPNDPAQAPRLVTSVEEAGRLCGERRGRLCTELEWERACRGPEQRAYAAGQACSDVVNCESPFGVFSLGTQLEWTASRFGSGSPESTKPVLRGQKPGGAVEQQHCGFRSAPIAADKAVAFRCCFGAPNAARVPEPTDFPVFETTTLTPNAVKQLLDSHPHTQPLAKDLTFFSDPEATNTVLSRGSAERQGFAFGTGPLLWSPTFGARYLVLAGKSGKQLSFVLTYHVLAKDEYVLSSSYVMEDESGPIVFAYSPSIRPRLHFSSCWGCPGETGKVLFRGDQVVILQP